VFTSKNIVIVGGGTAGWLTALYVNKISPDLNITLIESEEIGILGAGEGSVPTLTEFFNFLEIDEKEFIKETNATFKLGILFDNWNGDGKDYFHSFNVAHHKLDYGFDDYGELYNAYVGYLYKNNLPFNVGELAEKMARENKSPYVDQVLDGVDYIPKYAFHFDANLVAKFLKKVAIERGVIRVEGKVQDFTQDEKGNITQVNLQDKSINSDFVFDCSGFQRLIIGKLFKSPWKSYTKQLKANSALTFQIPQFEDKLEPYTKAICMKNGWMWQIPLQNRIGCGYVYDNNYITEQQAQTEIEEYLGHSIEPLNNINFKAGAYEKVWINNCLAIGLSSAFTEPIEATSIFNATTQLQVLTKEALETYDQKYIDQYNMDALAMNDKVLDFLHFHYITKRKDTKFWKEYSETTEFTMPLKTILETWNNTALPNSYFKTNPFSLHSWLAVGYGLDLFNRRVFEKEYMKVPMMRMVQHIMYLKNWGEQLLKRAYTAKEYIDKL